MSNYGFPFFKKSNNNISDWSLNINKIRNNKIKKLQKTMKDEELIKKLIIDPYFDIYTRNGLEYILSENKLTDLDIYLVDFSNVKGMNQRMGYSKVNDLFKEVFSILKPHFIIGRAFSGDEIFFCTNNQLLDITHIINVCKEFNLELDSVKMTYYSNIHNINTLLDGMINMLHEKQSNSLMKNLIEKDGKYRKN